ncbi:hypothetical protein [Burkholderia reimsis]|uniref:hypothetical protein n=1 Tax=Burkholderia reimsis TaxID=2234132 RepID=UPI001AD8038D|nr:hypothetical protein [Burkholderia reimsis]
MTGTATVSSYTDDRSYQPSATATLGAGTVTSVGVSMPGIYSVTGSPITTSGTITVTLSTQSANTVFAGPSSGAAAAPTFRALVGGDIPIFGASGSSHAPGGVPDPGSTAGSTRYLCENGTWAVPAGGGGGGGGTVTDVAAAQGVETASGADITTSGTIRANLIPTIYTSAHTVGTGDRGAGIVMNSASAVAQALPTAGGTNFPSGWYCDFANIGAGVMTLSVPTGAYLDGVLNGTLALSQNTGVTVFTDGSNWFSLRGAAPATTTPKDALGYYLANNPSASSFTLATQSGSTGSIANLASGRGFAMKVPATNGADNNTFAYVTPPGGSTWTMTAMLVASVLKGNATNFGLAVQDSNPNTAIFALDGFTAAVSYVQWIGMNSFGGRTTGPGIGALSPLVHVWMRLQYTSGGNFIYSLSPDGETWGEVYRVSVTNWLTVAPTKAGIWCNTNLGSSNSNVQSIVTCMSFTIA